MFLLEFSRQRTTTPSSLYSGPSPSPPCSRAASELCGGGTSGTHVLTRGQTFHQASGYPIFPASLSLVINQADSDGDLERVPSVTGWAAADPSIPPHVPRSHLWASLLVGHVQGVHMSEYIPCTRNVRFNQAHEIRQYEGHSG